LLWIFVQDKISQDVLTVGSTMRIPLLYRGEYSQWIESNKTAKDIWDALARHMLGFEYGEQDRKAAVLYECETFKAAEGELLLDTYIRYLQVINYLKKCGYSKYNCKLNFKFLNNLQPEWKQYATMMRQNKNLMDINIDALYNILKQNQGDVNDAMRLKKKTIVKVKVKDYEYYKTKMLLAKKDKDEQVLLVEDQAWMESSSDSNQEINANMVFMAQIEKVLSDSKTSSSSADDKISESNTPPDSYSAASHFGGVTVMKSSTTNVETLINEEVFHEVSESFQGESSSSSLNDDVQQSPREVILP
nr:hypothetical protein [Tanacetum cinerariifolium]